MIESFGELLRVFRVAAKLTQEQLADHAGISVGAVSALERGADLTPTLVDVLTLADALGLDRLQRQILVYAAQLSTASLRAGRNETPLLYAAVRDLLGANVSDQVDLAARVKAKLIARRASSTAPAVTSRARQVYLMSDLELPLPDRVYREPDGPHVAIVRGRDLDAALDHLDARPDCRALAVIGLIGKLPDLNPLSGRRLLVVDGNRARMREFAEAGMAVGAEVEWLHGERPDFDRVAAWALPVGAIILAAGAADRMGSNKLLLEVGNRPLVRHVIEAASDGGCHVINVVYADDAVRDAIRSAATCVLNPDATRGQSSSVRVGLQSLPEEIAGALVMLGDQPLVGARTVGMLLRAWRREGSRPAVAASYRHGGSWLPPVLLDRSLWPEVMSLDGDAGARHLFEERPELLDTVPVAGRPDAIDTAADYARIVHLFPRPNRA